MKKISIGQLSFPVLVSFALLSGCATDIAEMPIASISMSVEDTRGVPVRALLPETIYRYDFVVTDTAGEEYINPDYRDLQFLDLQNLSMSIQAAFGIRIETARETFHPPGTDLYSFRLAVKGNPYPSGTYRFPLDWVHYDTIRYSGSDGAGGEDGDRGALAPGDAADAVTGGRGDDGTNGGDGGRGTAARVLVTRYLWGDTEKLLLYEYKKDELYLTDVKDIVIDASGGDGGAGGRGGYGGPGTDYTDPTTDDVTEGIDGARGNGGSGGNGGNGGWLTLVYTDPATAELVALDATGGTGGRGGNGSDRGMPGRDGVSGRVRREQITVDEARQILSGINGRDFSIENVRF